MLKSSFLERAKKGQFEELSNLLKIILKMPNIIKESLYVQPREVFIFLVKGSGKAEIIYKRQ